MTDFASLGIKVDALQLVELVSLLNKVVDGSTKAESATAKLNATFSSNKSNVEQSTSAVKQYSSTLDQANQAIKRNNDLVVNYGTGQVTSLKAVAAAKEAIEKAYYDNVNILAQMQARKEKELLAQSEFNHKASVNNRILLYTQMFAELEARNKSFIQKMSSGSVIPAQSSLISDDMIRKMTQASAAANALVQGQNNVAESARTATTAHSHFNIMLERTLSIITAMAAYRTLSAIIGVPGEILQTNIMFEKMNVQLEGLMGSAQAARIELERMIKLDIATPFDLEGLTKTMIMFRNYGLEPTDMVMKALTDSVAKLGGGTEELIAIGRQLGQAWGKDKLQLMDIRPMIERGIPVIELMGKALADTSTGIAKTADEILKMSHAGTLNREEMILFIAELEKWAPDAAIKHMDTMYGQLSNITTAWQQLQNVILQDKSESVLKTFFKNMGDNLFALRDMMDSTKSNTKDLVGVSKQLEEIGTRIALRKGITAGLSPASQKLQDKDIAQFDVLMEKYKQINILINKETEARENQKNASETKLSQETAQLAKFEESQKIKSALSNSSIKDSKREEEAIVAKYNIELDANKRLYDAKSISSTEYYSNVKSLTEKITNEHLKGADERIVIAQNEITQQIQLEEKQYADKLSIQQKALAVQTGANKAALDNQVKDAEYYWQKIIKLETNGQTNAINPNSGALGRSQVLLSTALNPGYGVNPFNFGDDQKTIIGINAELQKAYKIKDDIARQEAVSNIVSEHKAELQAIAVKTNKDLFEWGHQYYLTLVKQKGELGAIKQFGDNSQGYMALRKEAGDASVKISDINGRTKEQIDLESKLTDLIAEKDKITQEGYKKQIEADIAKKQAYYDDITVNNQYISSLDSEIDRYQKLTMSVNEYRYAQELARGRSPGTAIENVALASVNDKLDFQKKEQDDAIKAMQSYGTAVSDATNKFSDLNSVTSAVFDGALGGVNLLAGAFDNLVKSIANTAKEQERLNETRKVLDNSKDAINFEKDANVKQKLIDDQAKSEKKYTNDVIKLNQQVTIEKLSGARQVAGAISGMLDKNTSEYKAAHAIEMALAGAELAMQLMKILGIGAVTAANVESVVPYVGATMTKAEADATAGVAAQAQAGPFIGFALMAAMAAAMAALGLMSGKSSITTMGPQGMSPTTGTILGDSTAQSESIDKTYQLLKDIHADEYATLRSIDRGISDLHSGITDVITRLFQAGGLASVKAPGSTMTGIASDTLLLNVALGGWLGLLAEGVKQIPVIGDILGGIENFVFGGLFGGEQTSTVTAQGIATSPTLLSDIIAGKNLQAQQFAQIETKTDGGWFGSDEFSFSTQYSALDSATQNALNGVFKSMGNTMFSLADNLGMGLSDRVKNYIIPALTVDLKGLDGEAAAKKLNGVLSAALDTMSSAVFGDILGQYQQLGEGMLETTVRIVSEVGVVKDALGKSGLSISGDAIAISDALVQAAGGLKEFQKSFDDYYQKFYTETERNVFLQKNLSSQLKELNTILPATREEYRKLIESLNINNSADAERYSLLIKLSNAADEYYGVLENAANNSLEIAKQKRSLEIQIMELSGNSLGALTEKRKDELAAMDASLRFSQQVVWMLQDFNNLSKTAADAAKQNVTVAMSVLQKAVADEKVVIKNKYDALTQIAQTSLDSLQNVISGAMAVLQKSVSAEKTRITDGYNLAVKATQSSIDSLTTSTAALLSLSNALKSAINATVISGNELQDRAGAQSVISGSVSSGVLPSEDVLTNALAVIARPSENLFKTFVDYKRDSLKTSISIHDLSTIADNQLNQSQTQLDVAKNQLELMKTSYDELLVALDNVISAAQAQVDAANGTTVAVMTVKQAQDNLTQATSTAGIQQINALNAQIESYKAASTSEIAALDSVLFTAQLQIDAANGTTVAVMNVESAIINLGAAITAQKEQAAAAQAALAARLDAISTAQAAVKIESAKKSEYDAAQAQAANSSAALANAIAAAQKAANDAKNAKANAFTLSTTPAPTTYRLGETNNALWEKELKRFIDTHVSVHGFALDLPWDANADTRHIYSVSVDNYNKLVAEASSAAYANAAALESVANAAAALIPSYQATAEVDQSAASQAAASYARALDYTTAAKNAVPGINSFAIGTNYVESDRWAMIHQGERVMPAADNRELLMRMSEPRDSSNDELIFEVKKLREEVVMLRAETRATVSNTSKTAKILERVTPDGNALTTIVLV